ncbi:MAG: DNA-binding transcriptional MerR regulator [Bacillariaceae sp.]|jgi:DNA-binding transcriptional MerR regulator
MNRFGVQVPTPGGNGRFNNHFSRTILRSPKFNLRNALILLTSVFVIRNFLKNDYRRDEIKYLRDSGMNEEQIERYIPKTAVERKAYVEERANDLERMKKDIAYLLKEVEELKGGPRHGSSNDNGRGDTLKSMDSIHEEKRRIKEEQLLIDHPNFKPSKRLKDSLIKDGETKTE